MNAASGESGHPQAPGGGGGDVPAVSGPAGKPTEHEPQPVPGHPGWVWWPGVAGLRYARRPRTSPPVVVRAHNWTALLAAIRKAEERRQA